MLTHVGTHGLCGGEDPFTVVHMPFSSLVSSHLRLVPAMCTNVALLYRPGCQPCIFIDNLQVGQLMPGTY